MPTLRAGQHCARLVDMTYLIVIIVGIALLAGAAWYDYKHVPTEKQDQNG